MRTQAQIKNLRNGLSRSFGTLAYLVPDETINELADKIQLDVWRRDPASYKWSIKLLTRDNQNEPWENIELEPKIVKCSFLEVVTKCYDLLKNHENYILNIQIFKINDDNSNLLIYQMRNI